MTSRTHQNLAVGATASEYFGSMIESYDSLIARAVPRYHEMTHRLVEYLPERADRVLELGCGTGNLSLHLATRYPHARLTVVDAASEMIETTRARLREADAALAARTVYLVARFEDLQLESNSIDLVTSCISLHHVVNKAVLYEMIFRVLRPGGTFRFADQLRGASQPIHELNWSRWLEFCREPGHCTEDEVQSLLDHAAAHDHYTPMAEHLALLQAAGFQQVDCVWRNWIWGIITAERP